MKLDGMCPTRSRQNVCTNRNFFTGKCCLRHRSPGCSECSTLLQGNQPATGSRQPNNLAGSHRQWVSTGMARRFSVPQGAIHEKRMDPQVVHHMPYDYLQTSKHDTVVWSNVADPAHALLVASIQCRFRALSHARDRFGCELTVPFFVGMYHEHLQNFNWMTPSVPLSGGRQGRLRHWTRACASPGISTMQILQV